MAERDVNYDRGEDRTCVTGMDCFSPVIGPQIGLSNLGTETDYQQRLIEDGDKYADRCGFGD